MSGVQQVTASSALPGTTSFRDLLMYPEGSRMEAAKSHFKITIDEQFLDVLSIPLIAGRDLVYEKDSTSFGKNVNHILVNEASLRAAGIATKDAVGARLYTEYQGDRSVFQIEGVVQDFHQFSMHRKVSPMIFVIPSERNDFVELCAAVAPGDYTTTLMLIEKSWKEVVPNTPFEHSLLTDNIKHQYESDQRIQSIITTFTAIAIFISCLGLYGLSIYVAERRVKEIGIRKVLGASIAGIVAMLTKDFIKLVAIAFCLAVPVAYYGMTKWLEGFEYKIALDFSIFLVAGSVSFLVAWITIGFESIKAALGNPVDALKVE